uniref:C3H1-type domain-containing protein n=1 Tax=Steinernema glaseri TaxID=37863 RepID=A0A1I7YF84_9BILA
MLHLLLSCSLAHTGGLQMSSNPSSSRSSEASSTKGNPSATTSQASVKRMELTREEKYKTELCLNRNGTCRYGADCWFAHTELELRARPDGRPPKKHHNLKVATPITIAVSEVASSGPETTISTATDNSPAPVSPSPFPPHLMQLFRMPPPHKNNFVPLIHSSLPGFPDPDEYRNILPMLTQFNSTMVAEKSRRGSIQGGL